MLPEEVLKEAAAEMMDYEGSGQSVMEMSHRSKVYDKIIKDAEQGNFFIGAVPQNDVAVEEPVAEDLYRYGTVCKIIKTLEMPHGTITAIPQAFKRHELDAVIGYDPYIRARPKYSTERRTLTPRPLWILSRTRRPRSSGP